MKIFCKYNILKLNILLVICIAKDFILTALKFIFQVSFYCIIFIYFFAPPDFRY